MAAGQVPRPARMPQARALPPAPSGGTARTDRRAMICWVYRSRRTHGGQQPALQPSAARPGDTEAGDLPGMGRLGELDLGIPRRTANAVALHQHLDAPADLGCEMIG